MCVCVCVKRAKHEFNHEIELLHKCNNLLLPLYFSYSIVGGFFPYCVPFHSPSLASSSRLTFLISLPPCLPLTFYHYECNARETGKCAKMRFFFIQSDPIRMNPAARTPRALLNFNRLYMCVCVCCSFATLFTLYITVPTLYIVYGAVAVENYT